MNTANTVFLIIAAVLVLMMTPGLAFFYGGLVSKKNVVNTMISVFIICSLAIVLFVAFGYELCFNGNVAGIFGRVQHIFLSGSDLTTVTSSGELVATDTDKEGKIVVQAAAIDGSGLKAELTIQKIDLRPASISIALPDGVEALTPSVSSISLQATVYPEGASQEVVWSIDEGDALASVSTSGMLRAVGEDNGTVVVRATSAEDASVSATIEVEKKDFDGSGIEETEAGIALRAWTDGDWLVVDGLPSGIETRLQVVSADGRVLLDAESRGEETLRMDVHHLSPGFYLLHAGDGVRQSVFRFIRR